LNSFNLTCRGNRAGGLRGVLQGVEADLVGVSEGRLLARDRAYADALLDVEAARLDDAFLEAPALEARVLEIQIGVIDLARAESAEHPLELGGFQVVGREQRRLCRVENQFSLRLRSAGSEARTSLSLSVSSSASTTPS